MNKPSIKADPVISEVRRAKTAMGEKYGFDVLAMVRGLRELGQAGRCEQGGPPDGCS